MAKFEESERVSTEQPLGSGVEPGMAGTVREVEKKFLGGASYLVKFDNGNEVWADEDALRPA